MTSATDADLLAAVSQATGRPTPGFEPGAIADQPAVLQADVDRLLASPLLPDEVVVGGLLYDLRSGRLTTLVAPRRG
jgi:carbonic anhydrase